MLRMTFWIRRRWFGGALAAAAIGLGAAQAPAAEAVPANQAAPAAQADAGHKPIFAAAGKIRVEVVAGNLSYPWSLKFLPDGSMLVTEKQPPALVRVSKAGEVSPPIKGLPPIFADGNGGLLGLALDPHLADNHLIYLAYSEPGNGTTSGLAVARAQLGEDSLSGFTVIFRQTPKIDDIRNFGGRIAFARDGTLFVGTGDRFRQDLVQDRSNTIGKLIRINTDGSIPGDNPFLGQSGVDPAIFSLGHRNIEGLAIHPSTGRLWEAELGPFGGDELNLPEPTRNYGWPLVSWGRQYEGQAIPRPTTKPYLTDAIFHWTPVISPSGIAFYDGAGIPPWDGNLLIGGLSSTALVRLTLDGERVTSEEKIDMGARIRDVGQGPDGALYLLTDQPDGEILRLTLEEPDEK
ncbi:PQQ-dependent sugar dehydrogenase [Jiella sp. M17.18]|uniref:PQQ-dependent sugar dehydrogenase n=1 Tax=Jiella sp. M17.18 TaxID=3234247 RepID=UPI0034DEE833